MYREGAVTDRTCLKWFANFHAGDFSLDDAPWLVEVVSNQIKTLRTINVIPIDYRL